jgi:glycosyltransferase involved in cell wall biosynthesis
MTRLRTPSRHYERLIDRIREAVDELLPSDARILVVSRGDDALLDLGGRGTWHFPQADNGAYAGHHLSDSAAAIAHLESMRERGGEFLLFPATALWWLDYYSVFHTHLQMHYTVVAEAADEYLVYDLRKRRRLAKEGQHADRRHAPSRSRRGSTKGPVVAVGMSDSSVVEDRHALLGEFDPHFYRERYEDVSGTSRELLDHYLERGWKEGKDPCTWFSTSFYLSRYEDIREAGINPFVHYVTYGRDEARLPTDYRSLRLRFTSNATVSAIVPNFNHARFLEERLQSIANQSYKPTELIILDDASSDDSRAVIERIGRNLDVRVTTSFNDTPSGNVFKQWRKGLSLASGDLIWICESDDFSDTEFLRQLVPCFNDPSVNLAFGRVQFADEYGEPNSWLDQYREQAEANGWAAPRVENAYEWFRGAFGYANLIPNVGGCVFRRQEFDSKVWREAERYSVCGDWYLYMHIANSGRIAYEPQAVSYFRQHGANTSVTSFRRMAYYADHYRVAQELRRLYGLSDDGLWRFYQRLREHFLRHFPEEDAPRLHRVFPLQKLLEERRRVRHIAIGILGFSTGGAEIFPIHLANHLARRGHHVSLVVLASETENEEIRNILQPGIPVYERLLIEDIGADRFFGTHGVDVMHTHYQGVDLWLHESCKAGEIPYIVTLHGSHEAAGLTRDTRESLATAVHHWVYTADKNLAFLESEAVPLRTATKLPNAVPEREEVFPVARRVLAPKADALLFGVASRALKAKGWDVAIEALRLARQKTGRPLYVAFCGDGDDYDDLRRRYGRRRGVRFLGYQSAITDFYRLCDCCLLPTRFAGESFPFTLIESLKAGTPIIATDAGEIEGIVNSGRRSAGIVIPWLDDDDAFIAEVADGMLQMTDDNRRARWTRTAASFGRRYSFERLVTMYEQLYESVVHGASEP